jgi:serine/threonine protein kinase
VTEGVQYFNSKNVRQGDISSKNLMLDESDNIKFVDFAGSSIDGERATVWVGSRGQAPGPNDNPTLRSAMKYLPWAPSSMK